MLLVYIRKESLDCGGRKANPAQRGAKPAGKHASWRERNSQRAASANASALLAGGWALGRTYGRRRAGPHMRRARWEEERDSWKTAESAGSGFGSFPGRESAVPAWKTQKKAKKGGEKGLTNRELLYILYINDMNRIDRINR